MASSQVPVGGVKGRCQGRGGKDSKALLKKTRSSDSILIYILILGPLIFTAACTEGNEIKNILVSSKIHISVNVFNGTLCHKHIHTSGHKLLKAF